MYDLIPSSHSKAYDVVLAQPLACLRVFHETCLGFGDDVPDDQAATFLYIVDIGLI